MKIVLATGIYPPDIGGPATYVRALAEELHRQGVDVTVVTYARKSQISNLKSQTILNSDGGWRVARVPFEGGPLLRWLRYAKALKEHAADADMVIAFSSVSCGVPLWLSRLKKPRTSRGAPVRGEPRTSRGAPVRGEPRTTRAMHSGIGAPPKKLLRLGGDFFWERYTDRGGMCGLREWYARRSPTTALLRYCAACILRTFDHVVFSTRFQEEIYEKHYRRLPPHSVIENAIPEGSPRRSRRAKTDHPLRLLYLGRLVGFKNLPNLLRALKAVLEPPLQRSVTLTIVGDGPMLHHLKLLTTNYQLPTRFLPPAHGAEIHRIFSGHDLLVLPSLTEISPNVALEARAYGLPVLLTKETGLSSSLASGMLLRDLRTVGNIQSALLEVLTRYDALATEAAKPPPERGWEKVADEYLKLAASLLSSP